MNAIKKYFKRAALSLIADIISFALIFYVLFLFFSLFDSKIASISLPNNVMELTEEQLFQFSVLIPQYYYYFIFLIAAFSLITIILFTVSRAIVWRIIAEKKLELKYLLKSIPLGLVWFIIIILLGAFFYYTIKAPFNNYFTIAYAIIIAYLSMLLFMEYSISVKFNAFRQMLKQAVKPNLLIYFAIALIIFLLLSFQALYLLISQALYIPYLFIPAIIAIFLWMSVSRLIIFKKRG